MNKSAAPAVENYIKTQKEHHQRQGFRTELLELRRLHGIEFDEEEAFK